MELARQLFLSIILILSLVTVFSLNCKLGECLCSFSQCIISETNPINQKQLVINCCESSKNESANTLSRKHCSNGYSFFNLQNCTRKLSSDCRRNILIYMSRALFDIVNFFGEVESALKESEESHNCEEFIENVINYNNG
ncbi:uncharacterized protein LOC111636246 [Centruroides sculpturatus]|uniref:uncharacterized protein LOC111636246 n=1 Tax=Centruroides sculpturatus TaxID=218467 RepID=UPI000C6D21A7|nr:uncharacterized protein LOC111636246 [Centruroides sculpturatus]